MSTRLIAIKMPQRQRASRVAATVRIPHKPRSYADADGRIVTRSTIYTYAISADGTGMIKIGKSADVDARVRQLQTACPVALRVVAVWTGDIERQLHERFSSERRHGEWFALTEEAIALVANDPQAQ